MSIEHDEIKRWIESRNGKPAKVKGTGERDDRILRIRFTEKPPEELQDISWEEFFKTFEDRKLLFLYHELTPDGHPSRFFKFMDRKEDKDLFTFE